VAANNANTLNKAHNVPSREWMKEFDCLLKTAFFSDFLVKNRVL